MGIYWVVGNVHISGLLEATMFDALTGVLATSPGEAESSGDSAEPTQTTNEESRRSDDMQALVRSILNGLQAPTTVVDRAGEITHINSQALELYDCSEAAAVGADPDALHEEASELVATALDQEEAIQQREETLVTDDGETPVERTVTVLYDDDENVTGAMLVDRDVSERNRQRRKKRYLEQYQDEVTEDLQHKIERLAEGDLTIDPTVDPPERDYDEAEEIYEEFTELNDHLITAVENIREVVTELTDDADDLAEAGDDLTASSEEVTAAVDQIDASSSEMARGADDLAEQTQRASQNVDDLSASIEEITASVQQIDA